METDSGEAEGRDSSSSSTEGLDKGEKRLEIHAHTHTMLTRIWKKSWVSACWTEMRREGSTTSSLEMRSLGLSVREEEE